MFLECRGFTRRVLRRFEKRIWYSPCSVRSGRVHHASRFHASSHFSWSQASLRDVVHYYDHYELPRWWWGGDDDGRENAPWNEEAANASSRPIQRDQTELVWLAYELNRTARTVLWYGQSFSRACATIAISLSVKYLVSKKDVARMESIMKFNYRDIS